MMENGCFGIMWFLESRVFAKRGIVRLAASGGWNVIWKQLRRGCDWLAVAWRLKVGCGRVEVPDGWCGVGKRLVDGFGEMVVRRLWLSGGWENAWWLGRVGG